MINALVRQQWALDQCTSQAAWSPWLNKARRAFNGKHVAFWLLQDAWERSVTTLISKGSATMASRFPSRGALSYPFMLSCWYVAWNALISVASDDQISAPLPVAQLAVAGSCRDTSFSSWSYEQIFNRRKFVFGKRLPWARTPFTPKIGIPFRVSAITQWELSPPQLANWQSGRWPSRCVDGCLLEAACNSAYLRCLFMGAGWIKFGFSSILANYWSWQQHATTIFRACNLQ